MSTPSTRIRRLLASAVVAGAAIALTATPAARAHESAPATTAAPAGAAAPAPAPPATVAQAPSAGVVPEIETPYSITPGDATQPGGAATQLRPGQVPAKITLTSNGDGPTRNYEATVTEANGTPVTGAKVDVNGLTDNPDQRLPTTVMQPVANASGVYAAQVTFPDNGNWMLQVTVHDPNYAFELFSVPNVTGAQNSTQGHDDSVSRKALLKQNPDFYKTYGLQNFGAAGSAADPALAGVNAASGHEHSAAATGGTEAGAESHPFNLLTIFMMLLHTVGAASWILAVLALALAARLGATARANAYELIAPRYGMFAGLGVLLTTVTGVYAMQYASAGLTTPRELIASPIGIAYLCVFVLKLTFVGASFVLAYRIQHTFSRAKADAGVGMVAASGPGAMPDDPIEAVRPLAETNAMLAGGILACVAILNQLHHVLH